MNDKYMTEGVWGYQKKCSLLRALDIVWALCTRERFPCDISTQQQQESNFTDLVGRGLGNDLSSVKGRTLDRDRWGGERRSGSEKGSGDKELHGGFLV